MNAVIDVAAKLGIVATCSAFGVSRPTYYRKRAPVHGPALRRPSPPRTLKTEERRTVLDLLHEPRFVDLSPAEVHATVLEEGRYLCSVRTMHRILAALPQGGATTARTRIARRRAAFRACPILAAHHRVAGRRVLALVLGAGRNGRSNATAARDQDEGEAEQGS